MKNISVISMLLKVVLLGDGAVGKTSLRERYLGKNLSSNYLMTIGADFAVKTASIDGKTVRFQIWDLAGQKHFVHVRSLYYRGALGGLLVYDVTRMTSYQNIKTWVKEFYENNEQHHVPLVLLGNKIDLRDRFPEAIPPEMGEKLASELTELINLPEITVPYFETSAKDGINVEEAFEALGRNILKFLEHHPRGTVAAASSQQKKDLATLE